MINALTGLRGKLISKRDLALKAIEIEQDKICEAVGSQDQVAASYGGINYTEYSDLNEFNVYPIKLNNIDLKKLENHLLLCFTGFTRNASEIAETQINLTKSKKIDLNYMLSICEEGYKAFGGKNDFLSEIGRLLDEQWKIKRGLTELISNSHIDEIYETAKEWCHGWKASWSGWWRFYAFFSCKFTVQKIKDALADKMLFPFKFDFNGSKIIYFS